MIQNNNDKKQKRSSLRPLIISVGVLILLLTATLAMFTSGDLVSNRFNGAKVDITLVEPNWSFGNAVNVVPEAVIPKDPKVINNEDVDVYVFLKVTVPCDSDIIVEDTDGLNKGKPLDGVTYPIPIYKFVDSSNQWNSDLNSNQNINSDWYPVENYPVLDSENNTYTYVFGYIGSNTTPPTMQPLAKGEETGELFNKIKVLNFSESGYDPDRNYGINVKAYGIQTQYLNGDVTTNELGAVWQKIDE